MLFVTHRLEMCIWKSILRLYLGQLSFFLSTSLFENFEAVMRIKVTSLHHQSALRALLLVVWTFYQMLVHVFSQKLKIAAEWAKILLILTFVNV